MGKNYYMPKKILLIWRPAAITEDSFFFKDGYIAIKDIYNL